MNALRSKRITMTSISSLASRPSVPRLLTLAVAVQLACAAHAQNVPESATAPGAATVSNAARWRNPVAPVDNTNIAPTLFIDGAYAANAKVQTLQVEIATRNAPADGRTPVIVNLKLLDKQGSPVQGDVLVTIENSGGRVLLPGAETAQFGPASNDVDRNVPGTQFKITDGAGSFSLLAPDVPGDVKLRLTAGASSAEGVITFDPDLREMLAVGLIEGVIRLSKKDPSKFQQARSDDGFEQEINRFSRQFSEGKGRYAARTSVFLKGRISGKNLLTLAYDSDKETRARLLRDIKPEDFYPVYGDASVKTFDAQSSDRLYVRVDNQRNYLLYGDYSTASGFSQQTGAGIVASGNLRQLGAYSRTLTGGRAHLENQLGFMNLFGARDTLKQVTEEYAANATRGPFALRNNTALENSEKVELIVRDKDARDRVIQVSTLERLVDYTFEPFSGRILLARPVGSFDAAGNPVSIRITYEVDQGGEAFWVGGLDGQLNLPWWDEAVTIGGSYVKDRNPLSPFQLASVNTGIRFGDRTRLIIEAAQSQNRLYSLPTVTGVSGRPVGSVFPTRVAGEVSEDLKGRAARAEFNHEGDSIQSKAWYLQSGATFSNSASGLTNGRKEGGLRAQTKVSDSLSLSGQLQRTQDRSTDAKRDNATIGFTWKASDSVSLLAGARQIKADGTLGADAAYTQNPAPGSSYAPNNGGGFAGTGPGSIIDAATGLPSVDSSASPTTNFNTGASSGVTQRVDATTAYLGAQWRATDKWEFSVLGEGAIRNSGGSANTNADTNPTRYQFGAGYQLAERTKLYLRAEQQTGLATTPSLDGGANESTTVAAGVDSSYRDGQALFSEYRLRDAQGSQDGRQAQWATGLRNTWQVKEGWLLSGNAEYLKALGGGSNQSSTAYALGGGTDYSSGWWSSSLKVDWRRVLDNPATDVDERNDSTLTTVLLARKLNRDWTLLARDYALVQFNRAHRGSTVSPAPLGTSLRDRSWQNRFQLGAAYRPVDSNRFNALAKVEYKTEVNINYQDEYRKAWIASTHGVWHPSRPWWVSTRLAAKSVKERFLNNERNAQSPDNSRYLAGMVSARLIYDITENWDVGLLGSVLQGKANGESLNTRQYAAGLELGYNLATNLWLSAGFNATGFNDRDFSASDYTNRGAYIRLRYKFDEDLFKASDREVNRSLPR
jgi:hypothetical protein